ncbi:MAG: AraC family transcriptional regulator [Sphingopyxis sp.]|nr:AraC family transcriptional regulator [Sphingopyxis sp.]
MESVRTRSSLSTQLAPPLASRQRKLVRADALANPANFRRFDVGDDLPTLALNYSASRWGLPEYEELPPEIDVIEPMGDPSHYRFYTSKEFGQGQVEFCALADGFLVHFNDVTHDQPNALSIAAPDMLRVRIASDGDGEYVTAQGDRIDLKGAGSAIVIEPAGMPPAKAVFIGHSRTVTVYIHRSRLQDLYADRVHELPGALRDFIGGSLGHTVAQRLPLSASLLRCLEDLHGCDLDGHSRRLFIRSKAIEILCHAFKAMGQDDEPVMLDASAQMTRGVIKAQQRLMDDFVAPPSLDDLAREVGLSRSSLCAGFRQIVGQTVFDYIGDLRMQQALSMLNERAASITQIAYAVGYSHPSSFSLAVQRRFGASPSELRRRGLPDD